MVCGKNSIWAPKGSENQRMRPEAPPCQDSIGEDQCLADRGHCLQYSVNGTEMDRICPGTCESCDGCRCQDSAQWHTYCPYWDKYCHSAGVLGNWMTSNCRKTCGKCKCKCCSYNGKQHALGARIPLPEQCGELVCEEGLVADSSPLIKGAVHHSVSHPEELTLNFRVLHKGSDCCLLPGNATRTDGSSVDAGSMVNEGWDGILERGNESLPVTCCHGMLSVPFLKRSTPKMENDEQCKQSYSILNDAWRKVKYVPGGASQCDRQCDRDNFTKAWYRFQEPAGYKLPIAPPVLRGGSCAVCQTSASAWIEERRDPVLGEGIININICNSVATIECRWKVQGKAVACQDDAGEIFYLYYLPPMTSCHIAYCALGA